MKKFKFKLQTVHSVREMRQEKEQFVLAQLQTEANKIREEIERIEQNRTNAIKKYLEKVNSGELINPAEMELNLRHIADLERRRRELQELLEEKKLACKEQSRKVAEANKKVKITERLRENQQDQYKQELEREEQNSLDEIISANFARRINK